MIGTCFLKAGPRGKQKSLNVTWRHDQVDVFVDPIEEEMLGIIDLHHHAYREEDVADLHQQC